MERIPNQVSCLLIQAKNEQDYIIMDTTRRKIIQSIAAAGVAAAVPGVANAVLTGTITNSGVPQPERPGLDGTDPALVITQLTTRILIFWLLPLPTQVM